MDLTAKLIKIESPVTGQGKNGEWRKQNIILETEGMYPKKVCVTVWGDKIRIDELKEDTLLTVYFDVESREFNGNWYTDLRAWKIDSAITTPENKDITSTTPPVDFKAGEEGEDLPF